ncbi:DUF2306 domain-containing protein [Glycomyces arizonensis]|uniref:DUF2306 domain-containing protein n=1 Tax=Glycomyces arizonensis TaxID=256035 RepID=UPI0004155184|nr:DUF2306 domain-containing protein [Glycomyces arizonensis]
MVSLSAPPDRTPTRRRGRVALGVVTALSIGIVLYSLPAYLVPGDVNPRVDIRDDVAIHLPFLIVHATTAGLALLLGPFQFFAGIRRNHPKVHRVIGRTYLLGGILPGSLSGIVVAALTTSGPIAMVTFITLDIVWFYSAYRAYRAVRARDFAEHERWMLRNMAFTFAAVTLRIYLGLFIGVQMPLLETVYDGEFERLFAVAYTASAVGSFAFNWLFIEIYLRRKQVRQTVPAGAAQ